MAIVVSNVWSNATTVSGTLTITPSVTPTEGRVMFAFVCHDGADPTTGPSGWTEFDDRADTGSSCRLSSYWKVVTGSESTPYTWSQPTGESWGGAIYELSGVDTNTPIDGTPGFDEGDSTSPTSPTITPTVNNTYILAGFGHNNSVTATVSVALEDEFVELGQAPGAAGAAGGAIDKSDTTATGTYVHTLSSAQEWISYTVAANPTSDDPTVTFSDANGNTDFIDLNDQAVNTSVNWEVYSGQDVTTFGAAEATGTTAISGGEIMLTLTGSSLVSTDPVTVILKSTTTNAIGAYFAVVD